MGNTSSIVDLKGEVAALVSGAAAVLAGLEPRDLPTSLVPALLDQFVELERHAAAGRVLLASKAVESERWKREGFASPAAWLAAKQGTSTGRAGDDLETSGRLGSLDDTADALRNGLLSPEQAGAIADAASINPAAEADLLDLSSRESLKQLKDEAARRKAETQDLDERARRIRRERKNRFWVGRNGAWNVHASGPIEDGAGFEVELEHFINERFNQARRNGERESRDAYAFDALMDMARAAGRSPDPSTPNEPTTNEPGSDEPGSSGDGSNGDSSPVPSRRRTENLRHLALVRVDLETLVRGALEGGETCEIAGLGPIPVSTARALLGESILKLVITRGVDVLHVTHLGRGPNVAQQIALLWSQPICTVEGCNRTARLQNDHRVPWATEQITEVRNLDPLCGHDHDKKTLHGWALIAGTGRRPMVPPDDPRHPANAPPHG